MKEKLFLVKKSSNYPLERLKKKSVPELTVTADYVLESFGSFSTLVTEGIINLSEYHLIPKQVQEERRKLIEKRMDELEALCCKVRMKRDTYAREGLYKYFKTGNMSNIRGVILKTRGVYTEYVSRVNKCSYRLTNKETISTGKATVARVLTNNWWKDNFDITVVYK